jgi:hypothetical protein
VKKKLKIFYKLLYFYKYMEFLYKKIEEKWAPFFSCHVQKFYTIIECVCVCV